MKSHTGYIIRTLMVSALVLAILISPISISQSPVVEKKGTPTGWSDDINLSNSPLIDQASRFALNNENLHTCWIQNTVDLIYRMSNDSGKSWKSTANIYHTNALIIDPDIAVSGQNVHAVINDYNGWDGIYYLNSTNNGESWNPTRRISPEGINAYAPHVFVNNSNVHIIWADTRDGSDCEIYYRRSLDGGVTWDNGQGVDADRRITFSPSTVTDPYMAGDGSNISVIWGDERNGHWELYWMISKDNGYTWQDGLEHAGQDRRLTTTNYEFQHEIAVNGSNIYIVYTTENWPGPTYNFYYLNSSDNGITWSSPALLSGPNSASYAPNIAVFGNNIWVMWNDNRDGSHEIFYKNSTDRGITWGNDTRLTEVDGFTSGAPKVVLDESNVHVVWNDQGNGNREIFYKRSPDFPDTTPPAHSNEIPYPDSYKDAPGTNVSVHVTDPSGVNESTIQLYINGSLVSHTLTPITDGYNVSWDSPGFEPGVVTCRIVADDNYGNQLDYTWNFTVLATYNSQLREGWNLISVPFAQVNTSIKEVLKDIDGKWDFIEYYEATSGDWKSYATFWPESLNEFQEINNTMAIWINITEPDANLTSRGIISTYTEIPLKAGWNFVGYPTLNTTTTVANALWGTGADKVEVCDLTDPYRTKEVGPTYLMKPGEGYWVHATYDSTWVVNW